jgi:hypothetical protein
MDTDTGSTLAALINRQLGRAPDAPLARGVAVAPEVLWFWVGLEISTDMTEPAPVMGIAAE